MFYEKPGHLCKKMNSGPRQHVHIGPIWDPCGLEYRPYMGYTCGIHIGMKMGFEWVPYGIYLGFNMGPMSFSDTLHMFPSGSDILPMWIL